MQSHNARLGKRLERSTDSPAYRHAVYFNVTLTASPSSMRPAA
jgi:hypothetical protein